MSGSADAYNGLLTTHGGLLSGIKTCNIFLDNIDRVSMDESRKERMKAEARFIRAFQFFRLTTLYGDIPHFDYQISLEESQKIERKAHAEVIT